MASYIPDYQLAKANTTAILQEIARDVSPEDVQMISIHPSVVFTDAAKSIGLDETSYAWSDGK